MKNYQNNFSKVLFLFTLCLSTNFYAQLDLPRGSQMAKVSQRIGITDLTVIYSRPSVNNRVVWGELVPYGMNNLGFGTAKESPWRAGANENTVFKTTHDIKVEGKVLPAGKYGLHIVVNENGTATIIFSKNNNAWGSYFYNPNDDALRADVKTKEINHVEQLKFEFENVGPKTAYVTLNWGKMQIPFMVEVNVTAIVLDDIRAKLQTSPGFNRQTWEQAANYSLNNGGDLDEALDWINAAIEGQFFSKKSYNNLNIKAQILEKKGLTADAEAIMNEALPLATVFEVHNYGRQLIAKGKKNKALEIFKYNAKKYKGQWPVNYGLARGYSALGNYKTALKHIKIAQQRAPDQLNKNTIAANISKLQEGSDIN